MVSRIILENIYYHPKLSFTLISQTELCKKDLNFIYDSLGVKIYRDNMFLGSIVAQDSLYVIDLESIVVPKIALETCMNSVIKSITLFKLHKLWEHISYSYIKKFLEKEQGLILYKITDWTEVLYISCRTANIKRSPQPCVRSSDLAESYRDHLHMNIWGLAPV